MITCFPSGILENDFFLFFQFPFDFFERFSYSQIMQLAELGTLLYK